MACSGCEGLDGEHIPGCLVAASERALDAEISLDDPVVSPTAKEPYGRARTVLTAATVLLCGAILVGIFTGGRDRTPEPADAESESTVGAEADEVVATVEPEPTATPEVFELVPLDGGRYRLQNFWAGTFVGVELSEDRRFTDGDVGRVDDLSTVHRLRWDDGTLVTVHVPRHPGVLEPSSAQQLDAASGEARLDEQGVFAASISIGECDERVQREGELNTAGLLVYRVSESTVYACRPDHRLSMVYEQRTDVTDWDIALLDMGVKELGPVLGARYLEVDRLATAPFPGGPRNVGALSLSAAAAPAQRVRAGAFATGNIWAEDEAGSAVWMTPVGPSSSFLLGAYHPGLGQESLIIAASQFGPVVAVSEVTGAVVWKLTLDEWESAGSLVYADDSMAFLTTSYADGRNNPPKVRSIDLKTGRVEWTTEGEQRTRWQWDAPVRLRSKLWLMSTPAAANSAPSRQTNLWALDEETGEVLIRRDLASTDTHLGSSVFVAEEATRPADDVLAVLTPGVGGEVLRVDPVDGATLWRSPAPGSVMQRGPDETLSIGSLIDSLSGRIIDSQLLALSDGSTVLETISGDHIALDHVWADQRQACVDGWQRHITERRVTLHQSPSAFLVASSLHDPVASSDPDADRCVITAMPNRFAIGSCDEWMFSGEHIRARSVIECLDAARTGDAVLYGAEGPFIAPLDGSELPLTFVNKWWKWSAPLVVGDIEFSSCEHNRMCAGPIGNDGAEGALWDVPMWPGGGPVHIYAVVGFSDEAPTGEAPDDPDHIVVVGERTQAATVVYEGRRPWQRVVVGLDADDGTELWRTPVGETQTAHMLPDGSRAQLIVLQSNGTVLALDPRTGQVNWRSEQLVGSWDPSSAVLFPSQLILQGRDENALSTWLLAIDLLTGEEQWRTLRDIAPGRVVAEPGRDLLLVAGNRSDPRVVSVEPATGAVRWSSAETYDVLTIGNEEMLVSNWEGDTTRLSIWTGEPVG